MGTWKIHSSNKHRVFGYYFSLIRKIIRGVSAFKKLYFADLYCGDGRCLIEETNKKYSSPILKSVLKPAKEEKYDISCFLNDIDPSKKKKLKERIRPYKKFIEDIESKDANEYYKEVLNQIPPDQFSIFYLDPTKHSQLNWNTIEEISKHTHEYNDTIRRPELIINFMVHTMLQSYSRSKANISEENKKKELDSITKSLGTDKWQQRLKKYIENDFPRPCQMALLDTFIEQLEQLGYYIPRPLIEIKSTDKNNTLYYLIFALNEKGKEIVENKVLPSLTKRIDEWSKENKRALKKSRAREKGDLDITEFCKKLKCN